MEERVSIQQWVGAFLSDEFCSSDVKTQIKAGWYVWFKNNCPLNGPLYDDFRFASLKDGNVQMTIQLNCCWNNKKYTVWGRRSEDSEFENDKPLFETDSSRELVKWLNTPWEE